MLKWLLKEYDKLALKRRKQRRKRLIKELWRQRELANRELDGCSECRSVCNSGGVNRDEVHSEQIGRQDRWEDIKFPSVDT